MGLCAMKGAERRHLPGDRPADDEDVTTEARAAIRVMAHEIETNRSRLARSNALLDYLVRLLTGKRRMGAEPF
jgi:hypothetical protein